MRSVIPLALFAVIANSSHAETRKEEHEKECSTSYERSSVLYEACYLDQMQKAGGLTDRHQQKYEQSAEFYCEEVSCNPSWWQRLKY